jgi:hypothetical protein
LELFFKANFTLVQQLQSQSTYIFNTLGYRFQLYRAIIRPIQ